MRATEILSQEHRLIERGLAVGRSMAEAVRQGRTVDRRDGEGLVAFLREFADAHHHGKEEKVLFPWMARHGFPRESGPLACMLHEHDQGRDLVGRMAKALPGLPGTSRDLAQALDGFASLLEAHIMKEDQVLFPMASRLGDGDGELLPAYATASPDPEAVTARQVARVEGLEARWGKATQARATCCGECG